MSIARVGGNFASTGHPNNPLSGPPYQLSYSISAGHALVVWAVSQAGPATLTVSDNGASGGNTYINVPAASTTAAGGYYQFQAFYALNTVAATTITVTATAGAVSVIGVDEYSGVATSSALDGTGGVFTTPGGAVGPMTFSSSSWTTSSNGDLICGAALKWNNSAPIGVGSGFTIGNDDTANFNLTEYKIQGTAGSTTADIQLVSGTENGFIVSGFALKAAAGGGASAVKQTDSDLPPPLGRGPTIDLRTSYQTGFVQHGAKAGGQSAELPPLGRDPTIDLRTAYQGGFVAHGAKAGAAFADLPPLGRGPTIDLRTAYQTGFIQHGAKAGVPFADLPPLGRGPPADQFTWLSPGRHGVPPGFAAFADLPPLGLGPAIDLRTSYQPGGHGAAAGYPFADLPPFGRGPAPDQYTSLPPGQHGAKSAGPIDASLPPFGRGPPADHYTWWIKGQTVVSVAPVPAYDTSLPPVLARQNVDLLTAVIPGRSGAPYYPIDASLPPVGRGAPADYLTWIYPGSHGAAAGYPFADLPPFGRGSPPDQYTSLPPGQHGAKAGGPIDASLPPAGRSALTDHLTWSVSGRVVIQVAKVPSYDTSLPPYGLRLTVEAMTSYSPGNALVPAPPVTGVHALKFRGDVGAMMTH